MLLNKIIARPPTSRPGIQVSISDSDRVAKTVQAANRILDAWAHCDTYSHNLEEATIADNGVERLHSSTAILARRFDAILSTRIKNVLLRRCGGPTLKP